MHIQKLQLKLQGLQIWPPSINLSNITFNQDHNFQLASQLIVTIFHQHV